jgi:hypothetical protein
MLPAFQLADSSYVCGSNLVSSHARHKVDLIGPPYKDNMWQAKADEGFDVGSTSRLAERSPCRCYQTIPVSGPGSGELIAVLR